MNPRDVVFTYGPYRGKILDEIGLSRAGLLGLDRNVDRSRGAGLKESVKAYLKIPQVESELESYLE